MNVNVLLMYLVSCLRHGIGSLGLAHLPWKLSYKSLPSLSLWVLCFSMTTVSELVKTGNIPKNIKSEKTMSRKRCMTWDMQPAEQLARRS